MTGLHGLSLAVSGLLSPAGQLEELSCSWTSFAVDYKVTGSVNLYCVKFQFQVVLTILVWLLLAVLQISAGFQHVKLGERGGRRRDVHDTGINTRQAMEHVKDSKCGLSFLN